MVTLSTRSSKLQDKLYLNVHQIEKDAQVVNEVVYEPLNHVFCCDVSGSMYGSLAKMRTQLKNRIPEIVKPGDTITIIAFSSPDICYVLKELVHANTPQEVSELQAAIDRYLVPGGWTDFVPPIVKTKNLINSHEGKWNWIFLSDGGHNDGPFADVIKVLTELQGSLSAATIIEYGYYADSANLSKMAELLSGTKVMAADFYHYVPAFEAAVEGTVSAPMIEIDVTGFENSLKYPQFVYVNEKTKSVHVAVAKDGKVTVPEYIDKVLTISKKVVGSRTTAKAAVEDYYAMAYVLADLLHYDTVDAITATLGDKKLIDMYQNAYGKQALFEFQSQVLSSIFDETVRGEIDESYVAPENKVCVLDLMTLLMTGDNYIRVVSPDFCYKRIGAKSEAKIVLSDDAKDKLANANTLAKAEQALQEAKEDQVKMTMIDKGYPISNFTWNEERANLSALMKIDVTLDLPKNNVGLTQIQSFVFRNYTIIKDGVLNVNQLPVILDQETIDKVADFVVSDAVAVGDSHYECILDLSSIPVINRKRVRSSKKSRMTKLALQLNDYKFQLKYLGYLKKELGIVDEAGSGRLTGYTADQLDYLKSLGITPFKGYSPLKEVVKNGDYYMALTLNSNFKGFTSIPKIEDIDKKLKAGKKLTPAEDYLRLVMAFVDKKYLSSAKGEAYKDAIKSAFTSISIRKSKVLEELSQMKFAMILSRKWFSDCESFEDNTDTITSDFGPELTIEYRFVDKKQNL